MTLDKKLARLRKREGLSQAEVSEELDVSRQAVTKWETGTSRPSIENLQSLSRLYNVPLEYLLDESEDELPAPAPAAPAAEKGPEQKVEKSECFRICKLLGMLKGGGFYEKNCCVGFGSCDGTVMWHYRFSYGV